MWTRFRLNENYQKHYLRISWQDLRIYQVKFWNYWETPTNSWEWKLATAIFCHWIQQLGLFLTDRSIMCNEWMRTETVNELTNGYEGRRSFDYPVLSALKQPLIILHDASHLILLADIVFKNADQRLVLMTSSESFGFKIGAVRFKDSFRSC